MKINKLFSIIAGLALLSSACALAQPKPAAKSGWKTYEAANGEKFEVNMDTIRHTQLGVLVFAGIHGLDVVAKPMIFDCHGHFEFFGDNDHAGSPIMSEWQLAPSRSIVGRIAKDVCAKR